MAVDDERHSSGRKENDPAPAAVDKWLRETYKPFTAKGGEGRDSFTTGSGLPIEPVYTQADYGDDQTAAGLPLPGEYPFTRGIYPTMYRGRLWTMRQYAGYGSAEESNRRYRYLLEQGQTGLSVAFDLPTQIGYDSDDPMSFGEVGKVGVAIDSLADMERLFDGIPLGDVSTSMTINAPAAVLLAMYIAVAESQGVPLERLSGTIQNDILKEYAARGTYIYPPQPSMRLVVDTFAYCAQNLPRWNTISISGYHMREAGATAVQEVAFTLANAIAYVEAAIEAGMAVDDIAPRLSFFFNADIDFLEEVAKFRAARRLWARIIRERMGAQNPRSWILRFHTQTSGASLTAQQPENNVVRVALQALAAVLGGTQSLHTNAMDEALALPSERAARIALRTQQVLAHESGVADTVDPLGGSYYIESLTDRIEAEARRYIERIDGLGGAVRAIEQGFIQREIQDSAYRFQQAVESGERTIVGVNAYAGDDAVHEELLKVDPDLARRQVKRLEDVRSRRGQEAAGRAVDELAAAAAGTDNLMPYIVKAVKAYATLGEICNVMRRVFGEFQAEDRAH
ncbi:MAG: methylmalonyl-CoA mutase family protein [Thermaerobacterales bacterium]